MSKPGVSPDGLKIPAREIHRTFRIQVGLPGPAWTQTADKSTCTKHCDSPADGAKFVEVLGGIMEFKLHCFPMHALGPQDFIDSVALVDGDNLPAGATLTPVQTTYGTSKGITGSFQWDLRATNLATYGGWSSTLTFRCTSLNGQHVDRTVNLAVTKCFFKVGPVGSERDTFKKIADLFETDPLLLWSMNIMYRTMNPVEGHAISIGRLYEVSAGDTLDSIALAFGTTTDAIKKLNYDLILTSNQESLSTESACAEPPQESVKRDYVNCASSVCLIPNVRDGF